MFNQFVHESLPRDSCSLERLLGLLAIVSPPRLDTATRQSLRYSVPSRAALRCQVAREWDPVSSASPHRAAPRCVSCLTPPWLQRGSGNAILMEASHGARRARPWRLDCELV